MAGYMDKWQRTADDFLAVLLVQPTAWQTAMDLGVKVEDLPDGAWMEAYRAILDIRAEHVKTPGPAVLADTVVASRCGTAVSVEFVAMRLALWDEYREQTFDTTCNLLRTYGGGHRRLQTAQMGVGRIRAALENGADVDTATNALLDGLRNESAPRPTLSDLGDLMAVVDQHLEEPPARGVETGVHVLDDWMRGMMPGENIYWVAPYKSRKTSILANIVLNMARDGRSTTLISLDESAVRFTYRMMALCVAEYMWNNGLYTRTTVVNGQTLPLNVIDGKMIRRAGDRWRKWLPEQQAALSYARAELRSLAGMVRIYDQSHGAGSLASIKRLIDLDMAKHGGVEFVAVDHIQRLTDGDTTYDKVESGSARLHDIAGETGVIMWVLSQQNENAIKGGDDGWSPQAKGGGGVASNADTVFVSKYKVGTVDDSRYVRVDLKLAREADCPATAYLEIHPASGWITPRRVDLKTIQFDETRARITGRRDDDPAAAPAPLDL